MRRTAPGSWRPNRHKGASRIARQVRSEGLDRNAGRYSGGAECLGCDRRMREGAPVQVCHCGLSFSFGRGRRAAAHAYSNHGLVIERFDSGGVFGYSLEEGIHDTIGGTVRTLGNGLLYSTSTEQLTLPITGVKDTVAEEDEHVSRFHTELELVIVCLVKQSEGQTGGFDDLVAPVTVHVDGAGKS